MKKMKKIYVIEKDVALCPSYFPTAEARQRHLNAGARHVQLQATNGEGDVHRTLKPVRRSSRVARLSASDTSLMKL